MTIVPEAIPHKTCVKNSQVMVLKKEQSNNKPSNGQKNIENSGDVFALVVLFPALMFFIGLYIWTTVSHKTSLEYPQFSIEGITASNIDISSSSLTPYYSSLSAQNLTINFVVENRAPT
ncbi:hypothetical protein A4A49_04135 [Nicotiana attenuata]|uniref:Uncharacterized protein n=1 Tax=Nicotiana attenuata TaxID=49451 RepID=A0A314L879_NICAT|nr:hypothetical protein A4A49_04135 [Nicotiana attenuata]